jgi:hypothetical protein
VRELFPSGPALLFPNTCSHRPSAKEPQPHDGHRQGIDEAPAGDLRLHPQLLGQVRLPAHGARHRQGGRAWPRPRRCTRTWPTSRRRACCGATRPSRGPSSCSTGRRTRRRRVESITGSAASRSSGRCRRASPSSPRRTIEDYVEVPTLAGGRQGRVRAARARGLDEGGGDPPGDYVVVRPAGLGGGR